MIMNSEVFSVVPPGFSAFPSQVMVTFSRGGGQFLAGKAADNTDDAACIAGTVAGALHVRQAEDGGKPGGTSAEYG